MRQDNAYVDRVVGKGLRTAVRYESLPSDSVYILGER
jgi:hypothetical protein